MSNRNGHQLTLPALLKRKRVADDAKNDQSDDMSSSRPKRRHLQPKNGPVDGPSNSKAETPKSRRSLEDPSVTLNKFRELTCAEHLTIASRSSPLPLYKWADSKLLWESMVGPDVRSKAARSSKMFETNPEVQPKMRSILLDWLIEVAEVYKLNRETYYLAQDYVDRVLFSSQDTPKSELQLLGITCLFIASKVEEIYPPKVNEFAYVTDGACTETAILDHEIYILQTLDWDLCPLTPAGWLRLYLQIACQQQENVENQVRVDMPRFPTQSLPMVSRLLDLSTLDSGCMAFSYSELAAGSFALIYGRECAIRASGFKWPELKSCVAWMARFAITLHTEGLVVIAGTEEMVDDTQDVLLRPELKYTPNVHSENEHNLQNHVITLQMLEVAQKCFKESFEKELTDGKSEPSSPTPENHLKTPSNKLSKHPEDADSLEKAPVKNSTASKLSVQNLNPKELFQSQE